MSGLRKQLQTKFSGFAALHGFAAHSLRYRNRCGRSAHCHYLCPSAVHDPARQEPPLRNLHCQICVLYSRRFAVRDSASQELRPAPDIQNGVIPYVLGSEFTRYSRCRLLRYRFGGNKCGILHPSNVVSSTVLTLSICTFGKRPIRQRLPLSFTKRPGRGLFVISLTAMKPRRFGKRWFGASITLPRLGIIQNSPGIFE